MANSFTDWEGTCLAHHGVKGQKHGIRRYQNEDGSLTAAGREHYGVGLGQQAARESMRKKGYSESQIRRLEKASSRGGIIGGSIALARIKREQRRQGNSDGRSESKSVSVTNPQINVNKTTVKVKNVTKSSMGLSKKQQKLHDDWRNAQDNRQRALENRNKHLIDIGGKRQKAYKAADEATKKAFDNFISSMTEAEKRRFHDKYLR